MKRYYVFRLNNSEWKIITADPEGFLTYSQAANGVLELHNSYRTQAEADSEISRLNSESA